MNLQHLASAVRFTDYDVGYLQTSPMSRWAISIRRLRRLLRQSRSRGSRVEPDIVAILMYLAPASRELLRARWPCSILRILFPPRPLQPLLANPASERRLIHAPQ